MCNLIVVVFASMKGVLVSIMVLLVNNHDDTCWIIYVYVHICCWRIFLHAIGDNLMA